VNNYSRTDEIIVAKKDVLWVRANVLGKDNQTITGSPICGD
jgi:hypothetical protein